MCRGYGICPLSRRAFGDEFGVVTFDTVQFDKIEGVALVVTLDALLYLLLYVFGFAFAFYPLTRWCKANEGFSWPWPHVKSEKKRIKELRKEQEQQEKK